MRSNRVISGSSIALLSLLIVSIVAVLPQCAIGQYAVPRTVLGAGAVSTEGTQYRIVGTLGQPLTGFAQRNTNAVSAGFWYNLSRTGVDVEQTPQISVGSFDVRIHPNPAVERTLITLSYPNKAAYVSIEIHDILGKLVRTIRLENIDAGTTQIPLDASGLSAGQYIVLARSGGIIKTKKLAIIR